VFPADPRGKGEIQQGMNLVDAAKEVGVKFFIWTFVISRQILESESHRYSSVPSAAKVSNGQYKDIYHFESALPLQSNPSTI
jgi:hypothetical protein